ncbi:uncharacterized protein TNCV_4784841 [Trichonephila clavipes]|nr:uncharacterized protein TNCV_4784841 [Trichonephila clavipes]
MSPGASGCLTLIKKGVPVNICCDDVLRALGCQQDPYNIIEERTEDPFPGPPHPTDFSEGKKRCRNGIWMNCKAPNRLKR